MGRHGHLPGVEVDAIEGKAWELANKVEEIEHERFGKDGFADAVARILKVEQTLGLADLAVFTASPPPTA